jgi:hypothetical protein
MEEAQRGRQVRWADKHAVHLRTTQSYPYVSRLPVPTPSECSSQLGS